MTSILAAFKLCSSFPIQLFQNFFSDISFITMKDCNPGEQLWRTSNFEVYRLIGPKSIWKRLPKIHSLNGSGTKQPILSGTKQPILKQYKIDDW